MQRLKPYIYVQGQVAVHKLFLLSYWVKNETNISVIEFKYFAAEFYGFLIFISFYFFILDDNF